MPAAYAAYATYAQFQSHWGSKRTANLTDALDASSRQGVIERGLRAASAMINTAASEGGFVIPISGATLFPADAALALQVADLLAMKCVVIASAYHLQAVDDTEKIKSTKAECHAWLKELAAGGGLPKAPPTRADSLITWIAADGASSRLTPRNIRGSRRVAL